MDIRDKSLNFQMRYFNRYQCFLQGLFATAAVIANDAVMEVFIDEKQNEGNGIGINWVKNIKGRNKMLLTVFRIS